MTTRPASECRRPIEDAEVDYLLELGENVRFLREDAGLSRRELAWQAFVHPSTIERIEYGTRRTRRSTLERIAAALVEALGLDDGEAVGLVEYLVELAGPALAPESDHADRIVRRRTKRWNRIVKDLELAEEIAQGLARPIAREMARGYIRDWHWVYDNPGYRHSP